MFLVRYADLIESALGGDEMDDSGTKKVLKVLFNPTFRRCDSDY